MEAAADTVPAVLANHGETFGFHKFLDRRADRAQVDARFNHLQRQVQAFLSDAAQALAENRRFADDKHFGGIAMEIIFNDGHVDIDDIAIFQQLAVIRDTVTDHFIDRNADGFRIAVIAEAGGNGLLLVNDIVVTDAVQFAGADARFDVGFDHFQHFGGQAAGNAHFFDVFRCLNRDSHGVCPAVSIFSTIIE